MLNLSRIVVAGNLGTTVDSYYCLRPATAGLLKVAMAFYSSNKLGGEVLRLIDSIGQICLVGIVVIYLGIHVAYICTKC